MGHAKVVEHSRLFAHSSRSENLNANPGEQRILSRPRLPRSAFSGLLVAALISAAFWGGLALIILQLK